MDFVSLARDLWEELHEQFSSVSGHRVYQVMKDIHALEHGDTSVEIYYHKLKNLWDEFVALEPTIVCKCGCKCGSHRLQEEKEQKKRLLQFLMGLNDSFAAARGQILMMSPLPSVAQAFSLIKQDEKQNQGYHTTYPFIGAVRDNYQASGGSKSQFSQSGNFSTVNNGNIPVLKCSRCNKEGHLKENCFKIIGYPPRKNQNQKGKTKPGATGFRPLNQPQGGAMQVSAQNMQLQDINSLQSAMTLDQLQHQMAQMSQMMTKMMAKQSSNTHEDHMTQWQVWLIACYPMSHLLLIIIG